MYPNIALRSGLIVGVSSRLEDSPAEPHGERLSLKKPFIGGSTRMGKKEKKERKKKSLSIINELHVTRSLSTDITGGGRSTPRPGTVDVRSNR